FPVEWLGFEAIAQEFDVQLNWETQHEVNNDYFEIERSADGQFFEVIGQLFPNDEGQYAYTDASPLLGNNQYRIKQIDLDGKFSFSPVRSVAFNSPASLRIRSYPNPFQERLQIERPGQQDLPMDISLYSANGQLVYSARGITQPTWTVEGLGILPKGLYYIHVFADQYHWSSSLIKADQ
ncbi:MAG: T9SS type A sorting domain-containing protein, partial [Bacteroidota bacterium]